MWTFGGQLGPTLGVVAVLAHTIGIVGLVGVTALENVFAMLLDDLGLLKGCMSAVFLLFWVLLDIF